MGDEKKGERWCRGGGREEGGKMVWRWGKRRRGKDGVEVGEEKKGERWCRGGGREEGGKMV